MIVHPSLVRHILKGSKTQHRIPTDDPRYPRPRTVGRSYAIQTDHQKAATCRVIVQAFHHERPVDITHDNLRPEGFKTVPEFLAYWEANHGDPTQPAVAVTFTLDRSAPFHGLHKRSERGYTDDPRMAVKGEPEAVDQDTLVFFTADARERFLGQPGRREHALNRQAENLSRQLRQEVRFLGRADMDVREHLERIQAEIDRLRALRERKAA